MQVWCRMKKQPPIVVDLGKASRRRIKRLKRGKGPLRVEIEEVMARVRAQLEHEVAGKTFVPVIVVYRRKRSQGGIALPFSF
jgi:hypothetical protein